MYRGISDRDRTRCKTPDSAQTRGIPYTAQLASSCPTVWPPARRIAFMPSAPSAPIPVMMTPIARLLKVEATDCIRMSMEEVCGQFPGCELRQMAAREEELRATVMWIPEGAM